MPGKNTLFTPCSTTTLVSDFLSEIKHYINILQEEGSSLLDAYHLFISGKSIWPDRCRRISARVETAGEIVRAFCNLLEDTALLPPPVVPYRYLLLVTLHYMDEQIRTLLPLIATFRSLCKTPSKKRDKLYREIEHRLELLIQDYQEALRHVDELSDQVRFEEKKNSLASLKISKSQPLQRLLL
jgi:hypothetical protein